MIFTLAKMTHLVCVIISLSGFIWRFYHLLMVDNRSLVPVTNRLARHWPHINDSLLLLSAFIMLWQWQMNPFQIPWLAEKLVMLCLYILSGMFALHWCRQFKYRMTSFLLALLCFFYIVFVALTKQSLLSYFY